MQNSDSAGLAAAGNPLITAVSGCPRIAEPPTAERFLAFGGCGAGLIDAIPALVDVVSPLRVPGAGVDALFIALVSAVHAALTRADIGAVSGANPSTENVTLLFTDLVGWTSLSGRLWPDTADQIRRHHFTTLESAIAACGGNEVKRLGDGTMVAFSTAAAALSCAVEMQRGVDRDNRTSAHPLGLRVGVSGGDVTREASDYFGDPVIEAARLCAVASGGKILAARVVKDMAGRRGRFPYRSLGRRELKGLADPFEVFEVGWNPIHEYERHAPEAHPAPPPNLPMPSTRSDHPVGSATAHP
jgi:class 3 adenylate cyclase